MKKPITVVQYRTDDGETRYFLGCGQGRLEAYASLGQTEIPAIIIEATREELMLICLVENLARHQPTTVEQAREIGNMRDRGHSPADIARKAGLSVSYVSGVMKLLNKGEERLLRAVEKGQIPLSVAVTIAGSNDQAIQRAMAEAYEKKELRGKAWPKVRRLIKGNLVLVVGYLKKLLDNARVVRYLSQRCGDILTEFQKIVETKSLATGD